MRLTRLFCAAPLASATNIELSDTAAEHLTRVLRARVGDALILFDGHGGEYAASVLQITKRAVRVTVAARQNIEREAKVAITLLQSLARGEKMDWIVQKATELGVAHILPVATARSVVQLDAQQAERKAAHWRDVAISACEQCGRNRLPAVEVPVELAQACAALAGSPQTPRWVLDLSGSRSLSAAVRSTLDLANHASAVILIGPEGGFAEHELALAAHYGFVAVTMGSRVLRTETAGLAALAAITALVE